MLRGRRDAPRLMEEGSRFGSCGRVGGRAESYGCISGLQVLKQGAGTPVGIFTRCSQNTWMRGVLDEKTFFSLISTAEPAAVQ